MEVFQGTHQSHVRYCRKKHLSRALCLMLCLDCIGARSNPESPLTIRAGCAAVSATSLRVNLTFPYWNVTHDPNSTDPNGPVLHGGIEIVYGPDEHQAVPRTPQQSKAISGAPAATMALNFTNFTAGYLACQNHCDTNATFCAGWTYFSGVQRVLGNQRCELFSNAGCLYEAIGAWSGATVDASECTNLQGSNSSGHVAHIVQGPVQLYSPANASTQALAHVIVDISHLRANVRYILVARASDSIVYLSGEGWGQTTDPFNCSTLAEPNQTAVENALLTFIHRSDKGRNDQNSCVGGTDCGRAQTSTAIQHTASEMFSAEIVQRQVAKGTQPRENTRFLYLYRMSECSPRTLPDYIDNKDSADLEGTVATYSHDTVMNNPTVAIAEYCVEMLDLPFGHYLSCTTIPAMGPSTPGCGLGPGYFDDNDRGSCVFPCWCSSYRDLQVAGDPWMSTCNGLCCNCTASDLSGVYSSTHIGRMNFSACEVGNPVEGGWYSTPQKGRCLAGQLPGDGNCTFRIAPAVRFVTGDTLRANGWNTTVTAGDNLKPVDWLYQNMATLSMAMDWAGGSTPRTCDASAFEE